MKSAIALRFFAGTSLVGALALACTTGAAPSGTCPDDRGCRDDQVCAFGLCVDPSDQRLSTVDIEIDGGEGFPVQTEFGVDLKERPRADVVLSPGVIVTGQVLSSTGAGELPLDAVVVAQPPQSVPGRVLAPSATTNVDGGFELLAVEGLRYAMTVSPSNQLPPLYLEGNDGFEAEPDELNVQTLEPILVTEGAITLTGVVLAGEGAEEQGIDALEVRVSDSATKGSTGRRVSSSTRTGADGSFSLTLREPGVYTLEVLPTVDNQPYPRVATEIDVSDVGEGEPIELAPISLGAVLTPVRFQARVVDADGAPVPGASLSVRGEVGNGEVAAVLIADAEGKIDSSSLPPATYDALVIGPAGVASAGMLPLNQLDVPSSNADLVFELPRRVVFSGTVLDPDDQDLAGASLTLVRIGNEAGEREPILTDTLVQFVATSDASGQFEIALDPGQYRLNTKPPAGKNAPANSELVVVTEAGLRRNVSLPDRAFVVGSVRFGDGPVASAYVRVFSTFEDEDNVAIVLGEGVTGPDGAFEIVVSDRIGPQAPDPP